MTHMPCVCFEHATFDFSYVQQIISNHAELRLARYRSARLSKASRKTDLLLEREPRETFIKTICVVVLSEGT